MQVSLYNDIFILDDGEVREFLFLSRTTALLIDTGFPGTHIIDVVRRITSLPITVLLTHGDGDHRGGLCDFEECYVHERDKNLIPSDVQTYNIRQGEYIRAGKYCFEVIEIPGHTPGSIALLDRRHKLLISGDTIQKGPIYMFGDRRDLNMYIRSLKKLWKEKDDIDVILPSHHEYPLSHEYIEYCIEDAIALKNGELQGTLHPRLPCTEYKGKYISFYA